MTWRFWKWFRSPQVVRVPESRISFELFDDRGRLSYGWDFKEDYLRLHVCYAGNSKGVHLLIDGLIRHTFYGLRVTPVNAGDIVVYSLVDFFINNCQVVTKNGTVRQATANPQGQEDGRRDDPASEDHQQVHQGEPD